jgi:hypothetical protein
MRRGAGKTFPLHTALVLRHHAESLCVEAVEASQRRLARLREEGRSAALSALRSRESRRSSACPLTDGLRRPETALVAWLGLEFRRALQDVDRRAHEYSNRVAEEARAVACRLGEQSALLAEESAVVRGLERARAAHRARWLRERRRQKELSFLEEAQAARSAERTR